MSYGARSGHGYGNNKRGSGAKYKVQRLSKNGGYQAQLVSSPQTALKLYDEWKADDSVEKVSLREEKNGASDWITDVPQFREQIEAKTGRERRFELTKSLDQRASEIIQSISKEIGAFHPIGQMSDMGIALGGQIPIPKGKEVATTPLGTFVFRSKSSPSEAEVNKWFTMKKEADSLRTKSAEYGFGLTKRVNTTIGNFRVVEKGRELREKGLLAPEEDDTLKILENFWASNPQLDRKHGSGIWVSATKIKPLDY